MGIRDKEIERIKKYCQGLNIKLHYEHKKLGYGEKTVATWSHGPEEIVVYVAKHQSKTEIILTLLHELGHNAHYRLNGKQQIPDGYSPPQTKAERKKVLDYERNGISYMMSIAAELDLKIPFDKIEMQAELDIWVYEYYYEEGHYPKNKIYRAKKKELKKKYGRNR